MATLEANFNASVANVFSHEGGYQTNKNDTGNFYNGQLIGTNLGITPVAFKAYYKADPTIPVIKSLTKAKASPIYKKNYWDKIKGDDLVNDSVADLMMDTIVNSGTGMIKSFKTIANATSGKKIMAETATPFTSQEVKLINALPQDIYFSNIKKARESFYNNLVKKTPSDQVFLKGWLDRLNKHVYSGASSGWVKRNPTTLIVAGLTVLAIGGGAYYAKHRKAA